MTATDVRPATGRPHQASRPPTRTDAPGPPRSASTEESAVEAWWNDLSADARASARRIARCGGYLPADLSHPLVQAGVAILMPDDVRRYVQHQTTT